MLIESPSEKVATFARDAKGGDISIIVLENCVGNQP